MPGIYLHIPFCRQACHYCNFHFSTSLRNKAALLQALHTELRLQKDYLGGAPVQTIYLGGGTPSLLTVEELSELFRTIALHYSLDLKEITLEANPDDIDAERLEAWRRHTPINRLSIGIQSFFDEDLRAMNRAHDSEQALRCLPLARAAGFRVLSVDLMYGMPTLSDRHWEQNLQRVFDAQVEHLSCYALTVEPRTALAHSVRLDPGAAPDEEQTARQFEYLLQACRAAGYEQYEISNFCRPPHYALHNSSYWSGEPYLGLGPSAHSFDGKGERRWNVANNTRYIKALSENRMDFQRELLGAKERYNEAVMTGLRTRFGLPQKRLQALGRLDYFQAQAQKHLQAGHLLLQQGVYTLSDAGKLLADGIMADLFAAGEED